MATAQSILAVIRAVGPWLNNAHDRVAFAVHAAFFALGHLLIGFGPAASAQDAFSTTSDDEVRMNRHWNAMGDVYAFIYSKPDRTGPNKVRVKCHRAQDKLVVEVLKESARIPLRLELTIEEFAHQCGGRSNYFVQYKNLRRFAEILNREIFDKLYDSPARTRSSSPDETDPRAYYRPSRTGEGAVDDVHLRNPTASSPTHGSQVPPPILRSSGGNCEFVFRGRRRTRSPRHALHRSDRRNNGGGGGGGAGFNGRGDDDR